MKHDSKLTAGEQVHFLNAMAVSSAPTFSAPPLLMERGQTLTLTADIIDASTDRAGNSWLDLVDDQPAQIRRWGREMFARGPWPEGMPRWVAGTPSWEAARDVAYANAWAIANESERNAALAEVEAEFGPLTTSHTLANYAYEEA